MPNPVRPFDQRFYVGLENSLGVPLDPLGSMALEVRGLSMGGAEQGVVRPKGDKTLGRGMTNGFVEGHVEGIPFSFATALKSRATAATAMKENAILKAAGFAETIGGSVSYALNSTVTPQSICGYRTLGTGTQAFEGQQGRGGVIESLNFSGGDAELLMKVNGKWVGKYHLGSTLSATVADGTTTDIPLAAGEAQKFGLGYYQWESEIVKVTAANTSTDHLTILRAQLGSTGVAHSAKPINPYQPAPVLAGSPISEANWTATIDGIATRVRNFNLNFTTGMKLLPPESGSKNIQGASVSRYNADLSIGYVVTDDLVGYLGRATNRKQVAVTIVCGNVAGGIFTFSLPYCEFEPIEHPDADDVIIATAKFRCADNGGNDMLTLTAA